MASDRGRRLLRGGVRNRQGHPEHARGRGPLPGRSLTAQAGAAFGWSFANNILTKLCTVGVGIVLARVLGPHSFGTYAVASVALNVMSTFNDLGASLAIVRWPGNPREIAPTVTTISVITSALLYVGCYLGAPGYAAAMGAPSATDVVRTLSIVILIDGFAITPIGLLQRYFRQDQRTVADQVNIWLGTSVTLGLALAGFGAMSIAVGRLVGCLASVTLLVRFSPEPLRFGFNRREARALLRFGLPLAGSGAIGFAIANVDQLVVGRTLGVTALGFFVLAANLSNWPAAAFSQPIGAVAPTALARMQHDPPAMRAGFETMVALVSAVTLPVCLVEAGAAVPLIGIIYGPRWLPAGQALTWLALLAGLQIFFTLTFDYFVVLAMSRVVFTLQAVWLLFLVPGLVVGARMFGIAGASLAELAVAAAIPLPWYLIELRKAGSSGRTLAVRLGLPLAGAGVAGFAAVGISAIVPSAPAALCGSALAGLLVTGLLLFRMRHVLSSLRQRYARSGAEGQGSEKQPGQAGLIRAEQGQARVARADTSRAGLARAEPGQASLARTATNVLAPAAASVSEVAAVSEVVEPLLEQGRKDDSWYPETSGSTGPPIYQATAEFLRRDPGGPA
jgi:O-antigen/teichoic acid export membrane protein